jgi:O-antigen/teichoic acid export membrane protein
LSGIILARSLGPVNRGYVALLISVVPIVLTQLGVLGLPLAAAYYIARDRQHARPVIHSLILPAGVQTLSLSAIYAGLMVWFLSSRDPQAQHAVLWTLWTIPAWIAHDYALSILQGLREYSAFNLLRIWPSVTNSAAVAIVWVTHARLEPTCMLVTAAMVVASGTTLAVAWRVASKLDRDPTTQAPPIRSLASFGLRAFLGSTYPLDVFRADQALVGAVLSAASLGQYVVANSFTNAPRFVAQNIGYIGYPHIASIKSAHDQRRSQWTYFWLTMVLSLLVVAPLELFMGLLVPLLFGAAFLPAVPLARILLLGAVATGGRRVLSEALKGRGNPTAGTIAEIASWAVFVPLTIVLLPKLGLEGVAIAFTVSAAIGFVSVLISAARTPNHRRADPPQG